MSWKDANPHLIEPLTPYARTLQDRNRLDLVEISEWIYQLSRRFYIFKGVFDQWTGIVLEQELHKRQLIQFEMRNFFTAHSSQAFQTFKMFMYNKQLSLYDYPLPDVDKTENDMTESASRHSPLIQELLELQATSGGKNMVVVEAPKVVGKHDDQSDALARSILLASEHIQAHPGVLDSTIMGSSPNTSIPRQYGYHQYHRSRARLHGGSSPERQIPRGSRSFKRF